MRGINKPITHGRNISSKEKKILAVTQRRFGITVPLWQRRNRSITILEHEKDVKIRLA